MSYEQDKNVLRELASKVADVAALPVQEEKRRLWRALNGLHPERPMVAMDQVCWEEIDFDGSLTPVCQDKELRRYERELRRTLFQWKHFPVDMVVEPYIKVNKAIINSGYGLHKQEETLSTAPDASVVSHKFIDVLKDDDDLKQITIPEVSLDVKENDRRHAVAHDIFDGVIDVRSVGSEAWMQLWDPIAQYKSVERALYAIAEDPDFVHRMVSRMMLSYTKMLDQLEEQGLLIQPDLQPLVHCTGAFSDELPAPGYDPAKPRCKDLWIAGLAQMLGCVSPAMHQEFELDYVNPIFERFGLVYYGCCERMDIKMSVVSKIPNLRKVSMSPWTDARKGAEGIGSRFVFSSKPSPAIFAGESLNEEGVRAGLQSVMEACKDNGCPLEFIMKDISTVKHDPKRLFRWAELAMEAVQG